jgi:hypothetical protein
MPHEYHPRRIKTILVTSHIGKVTKIIACVLKTEKMGEQGKVSI